MISNKYLKIMLFLAFGAMLGCVAKGGKSAPRPHAGLRSESAQPAVLRKVGSVAFAAPVLTEGARACAERIDIQSELTDALRGETPLPVAVQKGADSRLIVTIRECVEREGSALGVTRAGSVGFEWVLVDAATGAELWKADYHMTDQALSDNLLKIRERFEGGPGWKTAAQLMRHGFRVAARDFESTRQALFMDDESPVAR